MVPSIPLTSFFTDNQCIKEIDGWNPDATTRRQHGRGRETGAVMGSLAKVEAGYPG
jgi:hypothetical protein